MNSIKKLFAWSLTIVLTLTALVIPGYAVEDETEIMPIYAVIPCPNCGEGARKLDFESDAYVVYLSVTCDIKPDGYHMHSFIVDVLKCDCPNCGYVEHFIYRNEHCPFE